MNDGDPVCVERRIRRDVNELPAHRSPHQMRSWLQRNAESLGRKSRAITSIDALKPLKPPRCESKLLLRFLVRSAAQLRCVVNDIRTTGLNCRLVTYVVWWRCSNKIGKCWQPDSQRNGIVVDDVVHARAYF